MIIVRLLISVGSWLVWRVAEKATRPVPERTDMPSALFAGSEDGVESQTTKHLPSSTIGSVSFSLIANRGYHSKINPKRVGTLVDTQPNTVFILYGIDIW